MKFLATLVSCLLAASLLVAVFADEEGSGSVESSGSSEEASGEASGVSSEESASSESSGEVQSGDESGSGEVASESSEEAEEEAEEEEVVVKQKRLNVDDLTSEDRNRVITVILRPANADPVALDQVRDVLRGIRTRFQSVLSAAIGDEDLQIVVVDLIAKEGGNLQLRFLLHGASGYMDVQEVIGPVESLCERALPEFGLELVSVHGGLGAVESAALKDHTVVKYWGNNMGAFVTVIGVAGACLLVLTVAFLVVKSRGRRQNTDNRPMMKLEEGASFQTFEMRSPFSDDEIKSSEIKL